MGTPLPWLMRGPAVNQPAAETRLAGALPAAADVAASTLLHAVAVGHRLAGAFLDEGGIAVQWIQSYELDDPLLLTMVLVNYHARTSLVRVEQQALGRWRFSPRKHAAGPITIKGEMPWRL